ncbi:MAG: hypothetical protein K5930_11640 [Treponemataceae bacterium]|nr:hypothetical protein [Treponemataceae bacterium]
MNDIQKFQADIKRIIKHDRADNGGSYDGIRASRKIAELFISSNKDCQGLAQSISELWLSRISSFRAPEKEPSEENLSWLYDVQEFMDGTLEGDTVLTKADFEELRELIGYEAEDLPVDMLTSMMNTIMSHDAL